METQKLQRESTKSSTKSRSFFKPNIQKKLSVGSSNDSYEIEADNMANKVMRMSETSTENISHTGSLVQRKCAACEQEEKLQRKPLVENITPLIQRASNSESGGHAPSHVESQINSSRGGGSIMDQNTKNFMESRFGTDFSSVRIHTGSQAVQMSRELNAQAFTVGNDIYFNEGKYSPNSDNGKHLLAHELTHTLQQGNNKLSKQIQRYPWPYRLKQWHEVSENISETISNAPAAYAAWNNTFNWNSNFAISLNAMTGIAWIIVKLYSSADRATRLAWERAIQNKWNTNFCLKIRPPGVSAGACQFPIRVDVQWMRNATNAHYSINPQSASGTSGGRSGVGGTSSMIDWGTADRTDITHEFGHMLGNPEEYFTTNGHDYTNGGAVRGFRDTNAGVMNNPAEGIRRRHFELFRQHVVQMLNINNSRVQIITCDDSIPTCQAEIGDFPNSVLPQGQMYA